MKAIILVGGFGTRLRPLTFSTPKPCVEFCNKPMIVHQLQALANVGVTEVILAVNDKPGEMEKHLEPWQAKALKFHIQKKNNLWALVKIKNRDLDLKISIATPFMISAGWILTRCYSAGPLALARDKIMEGTDPNEPFFVLNSDITSEFPFLELLEFHRSHGKEGTIMVTKVDEPSKYGVVLYKPDGQIEAFVEKPKEYVGNKINAGIYIFNKAILNRIHPRPTSIEKEIFPQMVSAGELFCLELRGFWMDIGQPKDYLAGMSKFLSALKTRNSDLLAPEGTGIVGPVLIDPTAKIGKDCLIGPNVVIGPGAVIEDGARIKRTTVMADCRIRANAWIHNSIIGWCSTVGRWARVDNVSVLGRDVTINDELFVNGGVILPHKQISESIVKPGTIIM